MPRGEALDAAVRLVKCIILSSGMYAFYRLWGAAGTDQGMRPPSTRDLSRARGGGSSGDDDNDDGDDGWTDGREERVTVECM